MTRVTIVKLGGSAITNKTLDCTPDVGTIQSSIRQLSSYRAPLVLLHGAGSYGHPIVRRAHLHEGLRSKSQLRAIAETELFLDQLSRIIQVSLLRENRPFVPLKPMSFLTMRNGRIDNLFIEPLIRAIEVGMIPIIHGDLAFDSKRGVSVISADQLASRLGRELKAACVLFGCDVDGVFKDDPKSARQSERISIVDKNNARQILTRLRKDASRDVTGGIYGKVREALALSRKGHTCFIFNLRKKGLLTEALAGNFGSGTVFPPWTS